MDAVQLQLAAMEGVSAYNEWKNKFLDQWTEAVQMGTLTELWAIMPEFMKEGVKRNEPEQYKKIVSLLGGR